MSGTVPSSGRALRGWWTSATSTGTASPVLRSANAWPTSVSAARFTARSSATFLVAKEHRVAGTGQAQPGDLGEGVVEHHDLPPVAALVADVEAHEGWHEEVEAAIQQAVRTATSPPLTSLNDRAGVGCTSSSCGAASRLSRSADRV